MVELAVKQLEIINAYIYNLEILGDDDMQRIDVQLPCDFLISDAKHQSWTNVKEHNVMFRENLGVEG